MAINIPIVSSLGGKGFEEAIIKLKQLETNGERAGFVLQKALALNLKPIVVINKVDKANCRPDEVHDAVFELFFNLLPVKGFISGFNLILSQLVVLSAQKLLKFL